MAYRGQEVCALLRSAPGVKARPESASVYRSEEHFLTFASEARSAHYSQTPRSFASLYRANNRDRRFERPELSDASMLDAPPIFGDERDLLASRERRAKLDQAPASVLAWVGR
jgi:hypothetical protein